MRGEVVGAVRETSLRDTSRAPESGAARDTPAPLNRDKLFAARLHAARVRPYLATALFALHVVESRRVPTMAVDRHWRCYVSPAFVARMPVEELAGVWVHEVSHLLRDHHGRGDRVARERGLSGPGERLLQLRHGRPGHPAPARPRYRPRPGHGWCACASRSAHPARSRGWPRGW